MYRDEYNCKVCEAPCGSSEFCSHECKEEYLDVIREMMHEDDDDFDSYDE